VKLPSKKQAIIAAIIVTLVGGLFFAIERGRIKRTIFARIEILTSPKYSPYTDSSLVWNDIIAYADTAISDTVTCMARQNLVAIINISSERYRPSVYITASRDGRIIGSAVFPPERCFEFRGSASTLISTVLQKGWGEIWVRQR
jgi:hypothetical protein